VKKIVAALNKTNSLRAEAKWNNQLKKHVVKLDAIDIDKVLAVQELTIVGVEASESQPSLLNSKR
jgi:hypothetical protein